MLMKIRTLAILIFVLVLPVTLYFLPHHQQVELTPNKQTATAKESALPTRTTESLLPIQHWVTANGAKIYFVATNGIPMVDIQVNFDAGSARDGAKPGLSQFCVGMLNEGAADLNADQIADQFENLGTVFNNTNNRDRTILSIRSLSEPKFLNPSASLLATLLSQPTFPDPNVERVRNEILVDIKRNLQKPSVVASQALFKAIYQDHPYAHPISGTEGSVATITKNDLVAFHQQYYVATNATITIVGGITKEAATDLAKLLSEKLPKGSKAVALPTVPTLTKAVEQNIPFPTEQTHILTGQPCAAEGDPDYFAWLIGDYVLGSNQLNSRLFKEIREDRGLAYNVRSGILFLQQPGPFVIQLQTKNEQTKEAIGILKDTLTRFVTEGPTDKEVSDAKLGIARGLPLEINDNHKITNFVSTLGFYNLPLDYLNTYIKRLEAVSLQDIKTVFQKRIHPNDMALIVVGSNPN